MQHLHLKSWVWMYMCQLEHKNTGFLKQSLVTRKTRELFLAATERSKGLEIFKYSSYKSLTCQPVHSSSGAERQVMHTKLPCCLGPWICKLGLTGVFPFHFLITEKQITRRQQLIPTSHRLGADGIDRGFFKKWCKNCRLSSKFFSIINNHLTIVPEIITLVSGSNTSVVMATIQSYYSFPFVIISFHCCTKAE